MQRLRLEFLAFRLGRWAVFRRCSHIENSVRGYSLVCMSCLLLAVVSLTGCEGSGSVPQLVVTSVTTIQMPPDGASVPAPRSMTFDRDGQLYVLDNAGRVLVYDKRGQPLREWHMPEFDVGKPEGICVFRDGRIGVADTHYHRVVLFDANGNVSSMHGTLGAEAGQFNYPVAIVQDDSGNYYVSEYGGGDRVQKYDVSGKWLAEFGSFGTGPGQFQRPSGMVWRQGLVYVADAINNRIQVFRDSGEFVGICGAPDHEPALHYPYDLAFGPDDDLFVVEYGGNRLTQITLDGRVLAVFGESGHGSGQFSTPWGIAVDSGGRIVVADTGNRRMVEVKR